MFSLQRQYYCCNILLIVCLLMVAVACAGRAPRTRPPSSASKPAAREPSGLPRLHEPVIRVGLKTDAKAVTFSSESSITYSDGVHSAGVKGKVIAAVSFIANTSLRYSVQIGSFSSRENAAKGQRDLQTKTKHPAYIFENPDLHMFQLRLGPFPSQEKAQQVADEVKTVGYSGAFYVTEDSVASALPEIVVRDELGNRLLKSANMIRFWTDRTTIEIDGTPYRGYVSVLVNKAGRLTVINVLYFEDYLKGVVPNEIGPASTSTYEALKAQAVAARTYAYKNRKQFESDGYDLCATPRCQVYSGFSTENALVSRAVDETAGQVITFAGEPINALYTSTCGGKTENAEYMFEGWNYPYLKSVECYPEENEVLQKASRIRGEAKPWWFSWLSVKTGRAFGGDWKQPLSQVEVKEEVSALLDSLGKNSCGVANLSRTDWVTVADYLVEQLCWQAKKEALLGQKDYQYFLNRLEIDPSPEVNSFALLFQEEIMVPEMNHKGTKFTPYDAMTRSEFFETLFHIMKHYRQINSREGQVREITSTSIQVVDDLGVHSFQYQSPIFLYQKIGETISPKEQLACGPGDNVEYYDRDDRLQILVCELNTSGVAMDRSSKFSFWQEHVTPEELGQRIAKYMDAGEITDLQPLSYGVSGRVYEMKVLGTKNSGVLKGIRVRWGLGLRDNLFTIDRIRDRRGAVTQFVFTGRGWGHGVGMCQIGALGFAKQGKDYRSILQHYYTGVEITTAYR